MGSMEFNRLLKNGAAWAVLVAAVACSRAHGQSEWVFETRASVGANLLLTNLFDKPSNKGFKFPGFRVYAGAGVSAIRGRLMLNYGPSLSIYTRTIGANLNRFVEDYQLDFANSFAIGITSKRFASHVKMLRTFHNGDYYNLFIDRKYAALVGTNIILNNHQRHQMIGSLNANYGNVSINYYNDGPPFNSLAVADGFDRYWTGGGHLIVHGARHGNWVELSYDQFTGYEPLLYELSNILGINLPLYNELGEGERKPAKNFNTSAYHLKVYGGRYFNFDAGVVGNLVFNDKVFFGLQDIIHMKGRMSLHPNNDRNRFFIGGSYKYFNHVQF